MGWAAFLSRQRIKSGAAYNFAVSGSGLVHIDAQLTSLLAVTPRCTHVYVLTGTNSFATGVTATSAWSDLAAALVRITAAGLKPVVSVDLPRGAASWSASAAAESAAFNQLIRANAPGLGAVVVDPSAQLADPVSGDPRAGYYFDLIHPATLGGFNAGGDLATSLVATLSAMAPASSGPTDVYDAATNPGGNVLPNGGFTGTAGTNTSSGGLASGAVATGWNNRTVSGTGTSTASLVAQAAPALGVWQQLQQDSPAGVSTFRFSQIANPRAGVEYPASGSLVLEYDLEVTGAAGLESIGFAITNFDGAVVYDNVTTFGSALTGSSYFPYPSAFSGRARSEPLVFNAAANQLLVHFETRINNGAATVRVGNVQLRPA